MKLVKPDKDGIFTFTPEDYGKRLWIIRLFKWRVCFAIVFGSIFRGNPNNRRII